MSDPVYPLGTRDALVQLVEHGLVVDPWMAAIKEPGAVSPDMLAEADALARELQDAPLEARRLGIIPLSRQYAYNAVRETLLSSAAFDSHMAWGRVQLTESGIREAGRRVAAYIRAAGLTGMVLAYSATAGLENLAALAYYRRMREEDFLSGRLHRPWISRQLELDLVHGLAIGAYRLEVREGERWVRLGRVGRPALEQGLALWESSGYTRTRNRLLAIAQFNELADWDELSDGMAPDLLQVRRQMIEQSGILAGQVVLEVGSGTGLLTFEGGLADAVGPDGQIVALDPSAVLTRRARQKQEARGARQVRFVQGVAESLPFPDAMFDHVLSFGVMQYTQRPQAVREMFRVLRPGGRFAVVLGVRQPLLDLPIFQRWFQPLAGHGQPQEVFCEPGEVVELLRSAGFSVDRAEIRETIASLQDPARVVRTFLQFPFYQQALLATPYAERLKLTEDLVGRGRFLLSRYRGSTAIPCPLEWIFGTKPQ
jgi:SAM-dependent methyltransferase